MLKKYSSWFKNQTTILKMLSIVFVWLSFIALLILVACFYGYIARPFAELSFKEKVSIWYFPMYTSFGRALTLTTFVILSLIVMFPVRFEKLKNKASERDERGFTFMKDGTHGSSRWLSKQEAQKVFSITNIRNTDTTIFGQLSSNGTEVVGYKKTEKGTSGNRNVIVLASTGSGKSYTYVRTEIIQAALRGNSMVVTDPSGELYSDLARFLIDQKIDVRVLNLAEPSYSEFWNCLEETLDPETGRLDATRLNDFATIYMQNSEDINNKKDFWYNSALNLLKAVIGYTSYVYENAIIKAYIEVYKRILGQDEDKDNFIYRIRNEYLSFPYIRAYIKKTARKKNISKEEYRKLEKILENVRLYASITPYTLGQVFDNLLRFNEITEQMENIPAFHPASIAYRTFITNDTEQVRKSALQGILLRLQILSDGKIKEVLSNDGIHLGNINTKQSAYFVITSDKSIATKPISSLFFSFLFKDAQDNFDRLSQVAQKNKTENPCKGVVAMLDEFFSIGVIGGSRESFGTTMSNSRKRNIYISIIIQVYSQIEALYGEQIRDVIQGGCGTLLYLGGNDPGTCDFVSKFASGEATVLNESHTRTSGLIKNESLSNMKINSSKRFLLTTDEARRWKDEVLIVKQGEYPFKVKPFTWKEHPLYIDGKIKPTSIYSNIPKLENRLAKTNKNNRTEKKYELMNLIKEIDMGYIDLEEESSKMLEVKQEKKYKEKKKLRENTVINKDNNSPFLT